MKKIAGLLLLLVFFSVAAFAETDKYTFTFDSEKAGQGDRLDLSEYGLSFFLPIGFEEKEVLNNENAICYYQRNDPWHSVEFLHCSYSTLEEAKGEYAGTTPIPASINGMDSIIFSYKASRENGDTLYVCDAFIAVPNHPIMNYYEESADQDSHALYLFIILPDDNAGSVESKESESKGEEGTQQKESAPAESAPTKTESVKEEAELNETRSIRTQKDGSVNVRKSPSSDSERIASAAPDSVFPLISISENGWYEIRLRDGTTGFISPNLGRIIE